MIGRADRTAKEDADDHFHRKTGAVDAADATVPSLSGFTE